MTTEPFCLSTENPEGKVRSLWGWCHCRMHPTCTCSQRVTITVLWFQLYGKKQNELSRPRIHDPFLFWILQSWGPNRVVHPKHMLYPKATAWAICLSSLDLYLTLYVLSKEKWFAASVKSSEKAMSSTRLVKEGPWNSSYQLESNPQPLQEGWDNLKLQQSFSFSLTMNTPVLAFPPSSSGHCWVAVLFFLIFQYTSIDKLLLLLKTDPNFSYLFISTFQDPYPTLRFEPTTALKEELGLYMVLQACYWDDMASEWWWQP